MSTYIGVFQKEVPESYYDVLELADRGGELVVRIGRDGEKSANIVFRNSLAYRAGDEGDLMKIVQEISESDGTKSVVYHVEDSEFLRWFTDVSYGVRSSAEGSPRHYCIATANKIVDVISLTEPTIG